VKIRWITEKPTETKLGSTSSQTFTGHKNFELRFVLEPLGVKMGIHDGKEVILALLRDSPFGSPGLWSNNPSLAKMAESYFETVWRNALKP
jgi:hypothetical protein